MPSAFDEFLNAYTDYYRARTDTEDGNIAARPSMVTRQTPSFVNKMIQNDPEMKQAVEDPLNPSLMPEGADPLTWLRQRIDALAPEEDRRSLYAMIEGEEGRAWASAAVQQQAAQVSARYALERMANSQAEWDQAQDSGAAWWHNLRSWAATMENPADALWPDSAGEYFGQVAEGIGDLSFSLPQGEVDPTTRPGSVNLNTLPGYTSASEMSVVADPGAVFAKALEALGTAQRVGGTAIFLGTPDINEQAKRAGGPDVYSIEGLKWLYEQTLTTSLGAGITNTLTAGWREGDVAGEPFDPTAFVPTVSDAYSIFDPLQKEQLKQNAAYSTGTGALDLGIQVAFAVAGDKGWNAASRTLGLRGGLMGQRDLAAAERSLQAHLRYVNTEGLEGRQTWFGQQVMELTGDTDMISVKNNPLVYKSVNRTNVAALISETSDPVLIGRILLADRGDRTSLLSLMKDAPSYVYQMADGDRLWMKNAFNSGRTSLDEVEQNMLDSVFKDHAARHPEIAAYDETWHQRVLETLGAVADPEMRKFDDSMDRLGYDPEFEAQSVGRRLIPKRGYKVDTNDPLAIKGVFNEADGGTSRLKGVGVGFHEGMADAALSRDLNQMAPRTGVKVWGNTRGFGAPVHRYLSHITDRAPMNLVTFSSLRPGDSVTEMATWVKKSKAFRGNRRVAVRLAVEQPDGTTRWVNKDMNKAEHDAHWMGRLAKATNDSDRARIIRETEKEVISAEILSRSNRLTVDDLDLFIDTMMGSRDAHSAQIAKRGYAFTPESGSRIVYEPMFARQLADSIPLIDLGGLQQALNSSIRRGEGDLAREGLARAGVRIQNGAEVAYAMWRTGVLFNPKYTLKNAIFEPLLSSTLSAGSDYVWDVVSNFRYEALRASANVAEAFVNTAGRMVQPFTPTDIALRRALKIERDKERDATRGYAEPRVAGFRESPQRVRIGQLQEAHAQAAAAQDIANATIERKMADAGMESAQGAFRFEDHREFYSREAVATGQPVIESRAFSHGSRSGDGYVYLPDGTRRWGIYGAGGVLLRHVDESGTERFLLGKRSNWLSGGGGQWSVPGGALDFLEKPHEGGLRELSEELGIDVRDHTVLGDVERGLAEADGTWKYTTSVIDVPDRYEPVIDTVNGDRETTDAGWFTREEMERLDLMEQFAEALPDAYARIEGKPGPASEVLTDFAWADDELKQALRDAAYYGNRTDRIEGILGRIITRWAKDDPAYASRHQAVLDEVSRMVEHQEALYEVERQLDGEYPGWRMWKPVGFADLQKRSNLVSKIIADAQADPTVTGAFRAEAERLDAIAAKRAEAEYQAVVEAREKARNRVAMSLDQDRATWWQSMEEGHVAARQEKDAAYSLKQVKESAYYDVDDRLRKAMKRPLYDPTTVIEPADPTTVKAHDPHTPTPTMPQAADHLAKYGVSDNAAYQALDQYATDWQGNRVSDWFAGSIAHYMHMATLRDNQATFLKYANLNGLADKYGLDREALLHLHDTIKSMDPIEVFQQDAFLNMLYKQWLYDDGQHLIKKSMSDMGVTSPENMYLGINGRYLNEQPMIPDASIFTDPVTVSEADKKFIAEGSGGGPVPFYDDGEPMASWERELLTNSGIDPDTGREFDATWNGYKVNEVMDAFDSFLTVFESWVKDESGPFHARLKEMDDAQDDIFAELKADPLLRDDLRKFLTKYQGAISKTMGSHFPVLGHLLDNLDATGSMLPTSDMYVKQPKPPKAVGFAPFVQPTAWNTSHLTNWDEYFSFHYGASAHMKGPYVGDDTIHGWHADDWQQVASSVQDHVQQWLTWAKQKAYNDPWAAKDLPDEIQAHLDEVTANGLALPVSRELMDGIYSVGADMDTYLYNWSNLTPGNPADMAFELGLPQPQVRLWRQIRQGYNSREQHVTPLEQQNATPLGVSKQAGPPKDYITPQEVEALKVERTRLKDEYDSATREWEKAQRKVELTQRVYGKTFLEPDAPWAEWADVTFGLTDRPADIRPLRIRDEKFFDSLYEPTGHDPLPVGTSLFRGGYIDTKQQVGGGNFPASEMASGAVGTHWSLAATTSTGFGNGATVLLEGVYEHPDQFVSGRHSTMTTGSGANPLNGEREVRLRQNAPMRVVRVWQRTSDGSSDVESAMDAFHRGEDPKPHGWMVVDLGNGIPVREGDGQMPAGNKPRHMDRPNGRVGAERWAGMDTAEARFMQRAYGDDIDLDEWDALSVEETIDGDRLVQTIPVDPNVYGTNWRPGIMRVTSESSSGQTEQWVAVKVDQNGSWDSITGSWETKRNAIGRLSRSAPSRTDDLNSGLVYDSDFDLIDPSRQAPGLPSPAWQDGPVIFHGGEVPINSGVLAPNLDMPSSKMWHGRGLYTTDDINTATYGYAKGRGNVYSLIWKNPGRAPKTLNLETKVMDSWEGNDAITETIRRIGDIESSVQEWGQRGGAPVAKGLAPKPEDLNNLRTLRLHLKAKYESSSDHTFEEFFNDLTLIAKENRTGILTDGLSEYVLRRLHQRAQREFIRRGFDVFETPAGVHWGDQPHTARVLLEPHRWEARNVGGSAHVRGRVWKDSDEVDRAETLHNLADYLEGDNPSLTARIPAKSLPEGEIVLPDWVRPEMNTVGMVKAGALRAALPEVRDTVDDGTGIVYVRWNPATQRGTVSRNGHLIDRAMDHMHLPTVVESFGYPTETVRPRSNLSAPDQGWIDLPVVRSSIPPSSRTPEGRIVTGGQVKYPTGTMHPAFVFPRSAVAYPRAAKAPSTLQPKITELATRTNELGASLDDILTGTKAEYDTAISTHRDLSQRIDMSKRRQAELREQRVRPKWEAPWRPEKKGYATTKITTAQGTREQQFPELFQGALGASYREESSALNSVIQNYDPTRVQRTAQGKAEAFVNNDGRHLPGDASYWLEMAHWIDRTLKGDPLGMRIAGGASDEDIFDWLTTTNSGRKYARDMKWDQEPDWADALRETEPMLPDMPRDPSATMRTMVAEGRRVVEAYLPTPELRRWAIRSEDSFTASAVEAQFAEQGVPIGQLSPIHANEYQASLDLTGKQQGLKIIDRMWANLAAKPENAVGRFPWSSYQYRREMRSRLQQYADQGLDLSPEEINAIRHDAARATLDEMEKTFYTIRRQNNLLLGLRWVTAFPQAQANGIYRFTRLAARRPGTAAVLANAWVGAYRNYGVDKDGNPIGPDGDWSKMDRMIFDVPPALGNVISRTVPGAMTDGKVKIGRQAIDFLTTPPSASIFVSVPMSTLLANAPDVDGFIRQTPGGEAFYRYVYPFAEDFGSDNPQTGIPTASRSTFNVAGVTVDMTGAVPGSVRRLASIINPNDDEAQKAVIASWQYLQAKWLQEGGQGTEPTLEDAQQMARGVLMQNFIGSQTIPGLGTSLPGQQYRDAWNKIRQEEPDYQKAVAKALDQHGPWMIWYTTSMRSTNFGLGNAYSIDAYTRLKNNAALVQKLSSLDKDGRMVSLLVQDADTTFNAAVYDYYQDKSVPGATTLIREPYDPAEFARRVKAQTGWAEYTQSEENLNRLLAERGLTNLNQAEASDLREAWGAYKDDLAAKYPEWDAERSSINTGRATQTVLGLTTLVADDGWMKVHGETPYMNAVTRYLAERQNALDMRLVDGASKTEFDAAWDAYVVDTILPLSPDFRDVYQRNLQGSDLK